MTFTVGGSDVAKVFLGATPVDAVYLGAEKVWPPAGGASVVGRWDTRTSGSAGQGKLSIYEGTLRAAIGYVDALGVDRQAEIDALGPTLLVHIDGEQPFVLRNVIHAATGPFFAGDIDPNPPRPSAVVRDVTITAAP